jgi:hypothetical protein
VFFNIYFLKEEKIMVASIINAAPMTIQYGTQDLSTTQLPRTPDAVPTHLPKFYLYTQKGKTNAELVSGAEMANMFGIDSFDLRKKWANHATVFANLANAAGNACIIKRVVPNDAGPEANMLLSLDVLSTMVNTYARNSDGSIALDSLGQPTVTGTIAGYKVKWVLSNKTSVSDLQLFGQETQSHGSQIDVGTGTQSTLYPIFQFKASSLGEWGNNAGIRLYAPTLASNGTMPTAMMASERAYPYFVNMITRPDVNTSPSIMASNFGDLYVQTVVKPGVIDPTTDSQLYIGDVLLDAYQNLNDPLYPTIYGNYDSMHVYQSNIDLLLGKFLAAEAPYIDSNSDFTSDPADKYLFNFVSGVSSMSVPYQSFQFVDDSSSIRLTQYTNIFSAGGSDGTMNDTAFATLVTNEMAAYLDPNDPVQEIALNVESIMYDSGFPMDTKKAMCNLVSVRKDTFVALSTYTVGGPVLQASEEYSLAIALRTRLQMFPESDYFGTPVMRGMIIGYSGVLRNSQYKGRLPLTAELLIKSANYMGASNGVWKNGKDFDGAPGSVLDYMSDVSITWVPTTVRNKNWDAGLNWVQRYDRRSFFFPAFKTIYSDDTSVLNSYFTAMCICQLNKISNAAWREFSGVSKYTNAVLADKVNKFVNDKVSGRFDGRFVIIPDTLFTDMDVLRGYSWTLPIKLYANNMKTVMTTYVKAYRMSALTAK